jgi:glycine betaine/proline transport system ATP-binding protein
MQQRVGLARALATDAPVLLMDEPFSALDPLIRQHLQNELLDLQARLQKTILFVSHDLEEAMKLGHRIAIMEAGRIIQSGTPEAIVQAPATPFVAEFVARSSPLDVLTAACVMTPGGDVRGRPTLAADARLHRVVALAREHGLPVAVVDDAGRVLGRIGEAELVRALIGEAAEDPRTTAKPRLRAGA